LEIGLGFRLARIYLGLSAKVSVEPTVGDVGVMMEWRIQQDKCVMCALALKRKT
jgi:hypothetical protein